MHIPELPFMAQAPVAIFTTKDAGRIGVVAVNLGPTPFINTADPAKLTGDGFAPGLFENFDIAWKRVVQRNFRVRLGAKTCNVPVSPACAR
jgi:hypothetical protein